jgi:hypothetical protein
MICVTYSGDIFNGAQMEFYGNGRIGGKGQKVIPAKARKQLAIVANEEFVFFGKGPLIFLIRASQLNSFLDKIAQRFASDMTGIKAEVKKATTSRRSPND